jgi:hypothetical protein
MCRGWTLSLLSSVNMDRQVIPELAVLVAGLAEVIVTTLMRVVVVVASRGSSRPLLTPGS